MSLPVFDHLTLNAREDLQACCEQFESLGFTLTPPSFQSIGAVNRCAILDGAYLEIIAIDSAAPNPRKELLAQPQGLNAIVFRIDDAQACFDRFIAQGLPALPVQEFSRMARDSQGREREASFRVVRFEAAWAAQALPFGRVYFCQHLTPGLIFDPGFVVHRNGCRRFTGVRIEVRDLPALSPVMARIFGQAWANDAAGSARLHCEGFDIAFASGRHDHIPACELAAAQAAPGARLAGPPTTDHLTPYGNLRF